MPAWLLKLPWKWIGLGLAVLAAIGAIVWGAKASLDDARNSGLKQGRAEVQAKWDAEKAGRAQARAELSAALSEAFNGLDGTLQGTIRTLHANGQTIRVQVEKEMAGDPRYQSADCSLTDGVRAQIDAARSLSGPAAAAAVLSGGVPTSGAAVRLELGQPGQR